MKGKQFFPVLLLFAAWEILATVGGFSSFVLPSFSQVILQIWNDLGKGQLLFDAYATLYRTLGGFALASLLGIAAGILVTRSGMAKWWLEPIISVGFPMPKIAFLPIVILWFGVFDTTKIIMIVFECVFPITTATILGLTGIDRQLLWSAQNTGATGWRTVWEVSLPAALPEIMTGLQVALPIALIVEIVCEMVMGGDGIGATMTTHARFANSTGVFAGIVEISLLGFILIRGLALLRKRLLHWHHEVQASAMA